MKNQFEKETFVLLIAAGPGQPRETDDDDLEGISHDERLDNDDDDELDLNDGDDDAWEEDPDDEEWL